MLQVLGGKTSPLDLRTIREFAMTAESDVNAAGITLETVIDREEFRPVALSAVIFIVYLESGHVGSGSEDVRIWLFGPSLLPDERAAAIESPHAAPEWPKRSSKPCRSRRPTRTQWKHLSGPESQI